MKFVKNVIKKDGFTLTELLVSIQIFALISLFAYAGFRVFQSVYIQRIKAFNNIRMESLDHYIKTRAENEKIQRYIYKN